MNWMRYVICFVGVMLFWPVFGGIGCGKEDPCLSCKANELCKVDKCVPLSSLPDASVPSDQISSDTAPTPRPDVPGTDKGAPAPDKGPTPCSSDSECLGVQICRGGFCQNPNQSEPPPSGDGGTHDGTGPGGPDLSGVDRPGQDGAGKPDAQPAEKGGPDSPTTPDATPECTKDSDCASGFACQANKCVRLPPPCEPACEAGATCTNGTCEPQAGAKPKFGELCSKKVACTEGKCLEADGSNSYCAKVCTKSDDCKNYPYGTYCIQITQSEKYCVDIASKGDKCGFKSKLQALCESGSLCSEGVCKAPKEVKLYEQCGVNAKVCPSGMLCLRFGGGTSGYCVMPCTPNTSNACAAAGGGTCITLSGGSGACLPKGTGDHDEQCGGAQTGTKLDAKQYCKPGLECVVLSKAICMEFWTGDCKTAGKTCPSGRQCQVLVGGNKQTFGACFRECSGGKCPASYLSCRGNSSSANGTCWPN